MVDRLDADEPLLPVERVGLLIVRARFEREHLVARVTVTPDLLAVAPAVLTLTTADQVLDHAKAWLEGLAAARTDPA